MDELISLSNATLDQLTVLHPNYNRAALTPGIVHIGLGDGEGGLDIRRLTLQEITFIGTYTYTADDFRQTAQAIFDGTMGPLDWIDMKPLSEGAQAFLDIRAGTVAAPKTILIPTHDPLQ